MIAVSHVSTAVATRSLDELPQALRRAVDRGLERATELLRSAVAALAQSPFGVSSSQPFGEYAGSVRGAVREESGRPTGHVFLAPPADQYGRFVEVGSRPHFPPPGALDGWVRRRLGISDARQVREVAFLIGRKIARRGTPGHFFFERALRENEARVAALLDEEVNRALEAA